MNLIKTELLRRSDMYCFYENQYNTLKEKNQIHLKEISELKNELIQNRVLLDKMKHQNMKLSNQLIKLEYVLNDVFNEKKECPICNGEFSVYMPFGEPLRLNSQCPECGSLERHRLSYLYLNNKTNIFKRNIKMLHFAPEPILANIFSKSDNINYLPVDLFPGPNIKEKVDIQNIPYEENSFDIIYCSHVLEHVPDDNKALKELYRVLKDSEDACAIIQVPMNPESSKTLEKEEYNTPELRAKYYGQSDHLRYYGTDFMDKLKDAGFHVKSYTALDVIEEELFDNYGIKNEEEFYVCTKN